MEQIAEILATVDDEGSVEKATTRLRALGPSAVPSIFAVLAHGRISDDGPLDEPRERAAVGALESFAGPALFGFLAETIPWSEDARIRVAGLRVLGSTAGSAELPLVVRSALPPDQNAAEVVEIARPIERAFGETLASTLQRDPATFDALGKAWSGLPPALKPAAARAVGRAGTRRGLNVLREILAADATSGALVMGQVARLASLASPAEARLLAPIVREHLRSSDRPLSQAAIIAAGRLRDLGAVPVLVEALADDSRGVRENALWALRAITELELRDDPARWVEWYEEERAWFAEEGAALQRDLAAEDRTTIADALRRAAPRRLHRDELAAGVARVLKNGDATLRTLACRALTTLRARGSLEDLAPLLDDPADSVRGSAHAALTTLSGLDLPPDGKAWSDALAERAR